MDYRDIIVTPFFLMVVYFVAYMIRPRLTDHQTRRYFIPALTVKILGAILLGLVYTFYYHGGDTFNFHTLGSRHIWEAFWDSPAKGMRLMMNDSRGVYEYASKIEFFHDPQSFVIIRMAALFDLLTFSTYTSSATLFAVFSFIGSWMFFQVFYRQYPHLHFGLALSSLFIPSVFFWGSGILKDTVTLACMGIATFCFYKILWEKKINVGWFIILIGSLYLIFLVKKFILQAYLPAVLVWFFASRFGQIRPMWLKITLTPLVAGIVVVSAYYAVVKVGEGDVRYSIDNIAKTARITAYDIHYWTGKDAGSGYALGQLDDSFSSMVRLAPQAINVALFRPYLWEVSNPMMLMSALESLVLFFVTLAVIFRNHRYIFHSVMSANILFCLAFALSFAFAVGVSTFNFGTLVRYKIPLMPFYCVALVLLWDAVNSRRKLMALEETE